LARFHEANVQRSTFDVQRSNAELLPGSARSPRVGDRVLAIADFPAKDCFGETPKPARETRGYPENPASGFARLGLSVATFPESGVGFDNE